MSKKYILQNQFFLIILVSAKATLVVSYNVQALQFKYSHPLGKIAVISRLVNGDIQIGGCELNATFLPNRKDVLVIIHN